MTVSVICIATLIIPTVMSEEQPLLGQSANIPLVDDPESLGNKSDERSWAARTAHFLETPALHKTVIALVSLPTSTHTKFN